MANPIKVIKAAAKAATRAKTDAIQKSSVKVKPAAKQKASPVSKAKVNYKESSTRGRAGDRAYRENMKDQSKANYSGYGAGSHGDASIESMIGSSEAQLSRKITRKASASQPKKRGMTKIDLKVADKRNSGKPVVKVNSANLKPNRIIKKRGK